MEASPTLKLIGDFEHIANSLKDLQPTPKIHKLADEALKHLSTARELHTSRNFGGVTQAISNAHECLRNAGLGYTRTDEGRDSPSAEALQVGHAGVGAELHEDAITDMNEGLKNGR
jgi:hypothetical protein